MKQAILILPIAASSSETELLQSKLAGGGCPSDVGVVECGVEGALSHRGCPQSKGS